MRRDTGNSWYLTGAYGNGKTHLLYAQYREIVISGKVHCHVRTTRDLVEELRRAEFDEDFRPSVLAAASRRELSFAKIPSGLITLTLESPASRLRNHD